MLAGLRTAIARDVVSSTAVGGPVSDVAKYLCLIRNRLLLIYANDNTSYNIIVFISFRVVD
jgi:hypothetical protein